MDAKFSLGFVAVLVFIQLSFGNVLNDDRGVVFENHPGKLLSIPTSEMKNVTQMSSKVDDKMDCVFACNAERTWCRSVNFKIIPEKDGKHICELLSADNFTHQNNIQQDANYTLLTIKNPCEAKPCSNNESCVAYSRFDTHCEKCTGEKCESLNSVPKSCSELKKAFPTKPSGNYVIDPDGLLEQNPFTVYCNMTDKGGVGVTVVSHDSEARTLVDNCMDCIRNVVYSGVSLVQLANLTQTSTHCEQFIQFECKDDVSFVGENVAWWLSRDGVRQNYWGGATPGSLKCACGMTNTCAISSKVCNCYNGGSGWRSDSGLLTDKSTLPVTQMRFSDTDHSHEQGYHTLGKLKCYG